MHTPNTLETLVRLSGLDGAIAEPAMFANLLGGNNDDDAPDPTVAPVLVTVAPMEERIARRLDTRPQVAA